MAFLGSSAQYPDRFLGAKETSTWTDSLRMGMRTMCLRVNRTMGMVST